MTSPEIAAILSRVDALHADVREMRQASEADHRAVRNDLAALTDRVDGLETADQAAAARANDRRRICRQAAAVATGAAALGASVVSVLVGTGVIR